MAWDCAIAHRSPANQPDSQYCLPQVEHKAYQMILAGITFPTQSSRNMISIDGLEPCERLVVPQICKASDQPWGRKVSGLLDCSSQQGIQYLPLGNIQREFHIGACHISVKQCANHASCLAHWVLQQWLYLKELLTVMSRGWKPK